MRISFATFNTITPKKSFGKDFDLGKELRDAIGNKMKGGTTDTFVPSLPSQPIMIEKLEIKNEKDSGGKKDLSGFVTGAGTGVLGTEVAGKVSDGSSKNVNIDKMIDETPAGTNNNGHDDESISEIVDDDDTDGHIDDCDDGDDVDVDDMDD